MTPPYFTVDEPPFLFKFESWIQTIALIQLYEFEDPPVQLTSSDYHCQPELWRNSQRLNLDLFCNNFSNSMKFEVRDKYPTVKAFVQIKEQVHLLRVGSIASLDKLGEISGIDTKVWRNFSYIDGKCE